MKITKAWVEESLIDDFEHARAILPEGTPLNEVRNLMGYLTQPHQCTCGQRIGFCVRGTGDCMSGRLIENK